MDEERLRRVIHSMTRFERLMLLALLRELEKRDRGPEADDE